VGWYVRFHRSRWSSFPSPYACPLARRSLRARTSHKSQVKSRICGCTKQRMGATQEFKAVVAALLGLSALSKLHDTTCSQAPLLRAREGVSREWCGVQPATAQPAACRKLVPAGSCRACKGSHASRGLASVFLTRLCFPHSSCPANASNPGPAGGRLSVECNARPVPNPWQ